MNKKLFIAAVLLVTTSIFITSCAKVPKVNVPEIKPVVGVGPLFQIQVSPTNPKTTVGGKIVLTAKGVDKNGKEVEINPTWKCDPEGKIEPTVGKQVTFTGLKAGTCFVEVSQGDVKSTVAVEIK